MKNKFKFLATMLIGILLSTNVWGEDPIVLFHETFGCNESGNARDWDDSYSVKSGVSDVYSGISSYTLTNARQSKCTAGADGSAIYEKTQNQDASIIIGPLAVSNYTSLSVSYSWKAGSTGGTYYAKLYYKTSSGASFTEVTGTGAGATTFITRLHSLPEAAQVNTLYLKIVWMTSNTQGFIDEVELTGISSGPTCTPAGTALAVSASSTSITTSETSTLSTTGGNDGAVSYSVTSANASSASIVGTTFSATAVGTYTVTAHQDMNGDVCEQNATVDIEVTPERHEVRWHVGTEVTTDEVAEGASITFPSTPSVPDGCEGKSFYGWAKSAINGETDDAPTIYTSGAMGTADIDFYAVFATAGGGESTVLPSRAGTITSGDYYIVDRYTGKNNQGTNVDYYAGLQGGLINETYGGINVKEIPASGYEIEGNVFTLKLDQIADANKPSAYHVDVANDGITIGFGGQTFYSQFNGSIYADMNVSGDKICKWTAITNEDGGKHMLKITKGDLNSCLLLMDHTQSGNDAHYCKNNDVARCGDGGTAIKENSYGSGHMYFIPAVSVTYSNYVTSCAVYTVTFKSNGADVTTVSNVAPGQQVTAPTLAEIKDAVVAKNVCTNYLVGWSADSHYSNPSAAPDDILKPDAEGKITIPSTVTGDVTYYAVYAEVVQQ